MSETRTVIVALQPGTTAREQAEFAQEMTERDDVVDTQEIVVGGKDPDE